MLLRATSTFHAPGNVTIEEGALLDSSEPIVQGREACFEPADGPAVEQPVERATARPGSRSTAKRAPRKPKA